MQIVSNSSFKSSFFIKRVGNCGEPTWTPLTANNSFVVISDNPEVDFQKVAIAYHAGAFAIFKQGRRQPFITKANIIAVLERCNNMDEEKLSLVAKLQKVVDIKEQEVAKLKELIKAHQHLLVF